MGSFLKPTVNISQVLLKTIHVLATEQVNSTLEIDNSISADDDHRSGENLYHDTKETQRMLSCAGVVGADEPMQDIAICTIDFHHCFFHFPTRENEHDWYIFVLN